MSKFCTNIFLVATTSDVLWSSFVGVIKVDYFDFSCKNIEKLGELDVRVIAYNIWTCFS